MSKKKTTKKMFIQQFSIYHVFKTKSYFLLQTDVIVFHVYPHYVGNNLIIGNSNDNNGKPT